MTRFQVYARLFRYLKPYGFRFAVALACTLMVGVLNAYPALLIQYAVDQVMIQRSAHFAFLLALSVIAVYSVKGVVAYVQNYLMYWVGQRVVMDIRNDLHRYFLDLPMRFFERKTTGELMSKVIYDISLVQKAASSSVRDLGRHFFTLLGLLGVAIYQSPEMALWFLIAVPPVTLLIMWMGEKIRRITRSSQRRMGNISGLMKETYSGMRVVKAFGTEEDEKARFGAANLSYFRAVMRAMRIRALAPSVVETIGGIIASIVLWLGALRMLNGEMSAGQLSSFLVAVGMLYSPVKALTRVYHNLMEGIAGGQAVFEAMDEHVSEEMNPEGKKLGRLALGIRFESVSFGYEEELVLHDIDLEIPAGSVVAVVGLSGAGKTTMLDLIPRFYAPDRGRITYDGIDGADLDLRSLRQQIAVVGQQVILFNETAHQNIAYGVRQPVSREEVVAAARAANADGFISSLPEGYGTMLGEEATRLSGGERQRIAIARALLRNPSILLLDEATSALDSESEHIIQDALERLMKGRTTLVVAHRLSTVRNADLIVVLEGGRIAEQGTHDELMARDGLYRRLCEMQFATPNGPQGDGAPRVPAASPEAGKPE